MKITVFVIYNKNNFEIDISDMCLSELSTKYFYSMLDELGLSDNYSWIGINIDTKRFETFGVFDFERTLTKLAIKAYCEKYLRENYRNP